LNTTWSIFARGATFYYGYWPSKGESGKRVWLRKPLGFQYDDSKNLANLTLGKLFGTGALQKGLELFYNNIKVVRKEEKIEVEGPSEKNDAYKAIIDEINNRNISSSEKEKLSKSFTDYVERLKDFPKSEGMIQKEVYLLLHPDGKNKDTYMKELDEKITEIRNSGNILPKIKARVRWTLLYKLEKFQDMVKFQEWMGDKAEFKTALEQIER